MPVVTPPFLDPLTGADVALLASEQQWSVLLWLVPVAAVVVVAVAAGQLVTGAASGSRGRALTVLAVSAAILVAYLVALVLVQNEIGDSSVDWLLPDAVGLAGAGYWVAVLGAAAGVVGGALGLDAKPSPSVVLGVIGSLVVLGGATAALVVVVPLGGPDPSPVSPATPATPVNEVGGTSTLRPSPSPAPVSARESLDQLVAADRSEVDSLVGSWVPQLSSKRVGLEADGIVYDYAGILQHYQSLTGRQPGALLLRSNDYPSFRESGFYVAVMPVGFATGEEALDWCASQGLGRDDCFAKRILETGDTEHNTLYPR